MPRAKDLAFPTSIILSRKKPTDYFAEHKKKLLKEYDRWEGSYNEWRKKNPELAVQLDNAIERKVPADLLSKIPEFPEGFEAGDAQGG